METPNGRESSTWLDCEKGWFNRARYATLNFQVPKTLTRENQGLHSVGNLVLCAAGDGERINASRIEERVAHFEVIVRKRKPGNWLAAVEMVNYTFWNWGTGSPAGLVRLT